MKFPKNIDINKLQFIGSGTQGSVYKIDDEKCIKIFKKKSHCLKEITTMLMSQVDYHFPILYSYGDKYIIREYIDGIELDKYLLSNSLTPYLSNKLIELYDAMNFVGFSRLDTTLFHILLTDQYELKIIDTARAMKKETIYPKLILEGLDKLNYKNQFLSYVKIVRPDLYNRWNSINNFY